MAEITRGPATAAEAEALLAAGKIAAADAPPVDPALVTDGPKSVEVPRGYSVRLKGLSDDECSVTFLDKRVVTLKRPTVATQFVQARILAGIMPKPPEGGYPENLMWQVKALLFVATIDGKPVSRPTDHVEAQELLNRLGDEGADGIAAAYVQHFVARGVQLPL